MTTNLVLKSNDSLYYASGRAKFKVNWGQFLDDPRAEYQVSFSFMTEVDGTLDENDLYTLSLDVTGSTLKMIKGGQTNSSCVQEIGIVYSEEPHSSHARLRADFSTNPPVNLASRPTADIFEVSFRDVSGALSAKSPAFILFLRFQKI
jgi:hypothetical protein